MRVIIVVFFCLIALAQSNSISEYVMALYYPVGTMLEGWRPRALEGCPEQAKKYPVAMTELKDCLKAANASVDTYCNEFQKNIERCFKPVINLATDCLPEKSKDLPRMFIRGYVSVNHFLCEIKDNTKMIAGFHCPMDSQKHTCLRTPHKSLEKLASHLSTKSEVCQYAVEITSCFRNAVEENKCQDTYVKLYNAAFTECGNNSV